MKRHVMNSPRLATALLVGLFATGILAPAVATRQDAVLEERVVELEEKVKALEAYLAQQAESAKSLSTSLDTSEKEGFTFGINPRSREVLLEGFRGLAKSLQTGAPKAEKEASDEGGRRR